MSQGSEQVKDRPIIFSAPMVHALLDGRKSQTRRIVKPQPPAEFCGPHCAAITNGRLWAFSTGHKAYPADPAPGITCPFGVPGDRLYVRESVWKHRDTGEYRYGDDASYASWRECGWKRVPSIHMPRHLSRLTLTITDVRVERVQDISELDARKEGVDEAVGYCTDPQRVHTDGFRRLWNLIHGPGAWERNDWVWALTFTTEVRK